MSGPTPISSTRLAETPAIVVEIRKWHAAPSGARAGFCDVAVPAWGIILHDCAVFKKTEDGSTRVSIALPNKKVGDKWLPAVEWIDRRSPIAQTISNATIEALKDYIRTNGGAA